MMSKHKHSPATGGRPFPWRCPSCAAESVEMAVTRYIAEVNHDGRLYEVEVPSLCIPKCNACGELVFTLEADEQISVALRGQLGLLQPSDIRNRRKELSLRQSDVAKSLGAAEATISRWETGALIQSKAMD